MSEAVDDHAVLAAAFDAVGSDAGWDAFLRVWAARFRSEGAQITGWAQGSDPSGAFGIRFHGPYDVASLARYSEYYLRQSDCKATALMTTHRGRAVSAAVLAPAGASMIEAIENIRGREAYHEFFRPIGVDWVVGILSEPFAMPGLTDPVGVGLGLMRRFPAGDYAIDERCAIDRLAPLVRRALALHWRVAALDARVAGSFGAVDGLSEGVVFADRDGQVDHLNPAAERLLAAGDGLAIRRGRLVADRADDRSSLHRAIFAAAGFARREGAPGDELRVARPSGRGAYRVTVAPPPRREIGFGLITAGRVVVTIADPDDSPAPPSGVLRHRYGLTQGEADIALALASGETVSAYADRRGVSVNTVRTLLKRAMDKTGCTRQAQLVALVLGARP